jgi:hypothetical protein
MGESRGPARARPAAHGAAASTLVSGLMNPKSSGSVDRSADRAAATSWSKMAVNTYSSVSECAGRVITHTPGWVQAGSATADMMITG